MTKKLCTSSIPSKRPNSKHNSPINLNHKLRKRLNWSEPREIPFSNKPSKLLKLTLKPKSRLRRLLKSPLKPKRRVPKTSKLDSNRSKKNGWPRRRN